MDKELELSHRDPKFLPIQYDMESARIKQLTEEFDPKSIPKAVEKGDDGYLVIHEKTMSLVKIRTNIDRVRKALKSDALAWGKKVDGQAKIYTTLVEKLEEPWREIKTKLDEKEAREEAEARELEISKMKLIENRILYIKELANGLLGANSKLIQGRIDELREVPVDDARFGDYAEAAIVTKQVVLDSLIAAHRERVVFEDGLKKHAREKAELKEQRELLAKEKAELKASQEAVEQRKLEEENRIKEESDRQEREAAAAEEAKQAEATAKKRLPEDIKVRDYVNKLVGIKQPAVRDKGLVSLLAHLASELEIIKAFVYDRTGGEEK